MTKRQQNQVLRDCESLQTYNPSSTIVILNMMTPETIQQRSLML